MPAHQRRWRDDERLPAAARQQPARRCQKDTVRPRQRRTTGPSPEDGEFVPQHDDFQFFEIVRPNAQEGELQNPSEHHVTERDKHDASLRLAGTPGTFYASATELRFPRRVSQAWMRDPDKCTLQVCFTCRLPKRDVAIEIRVGDMFSLPGAFVIGSNTSFDTDIDSNLISKRSVQGQFTQKYYNSVSHIDADLNAALAGIAPERTAATKKGKTQIYKIGTTVHVVTQGRRAYFVAIASVNDGGVAQGTFEDLQNSLPMLWDYIATRGGDFEALVVPVLGSAYARLSQPREEIIRAIVNSFVAACSSSRPAEKMTIVIPFKDFYDH